ncbi:hypothetical protein AMTR_s00056p00022760 [Amborella trichopoda]|uniref:Uncharacterized protein n=1 Tax=Amborella trichopoda TaxID=13333 RepID=U5D3Z8_AMBTC|nr:hypothetical protein AMTR_s00056p00022760 [Amborella trichopoda]
MEDDMEPDERLNEPTTTTKVFALTFTMVLMKFVAEEGIFEIIIDDAKLIVAVGWVILIFSCLVQTVRAMNTLLWMSRYALNLGIILILTAVFLDFKNNLLTDYGISS